MESLKPLDMNSVMDIKFIKEMFSSIQARTSALCFQCTTCTNGCPVVLNFKPRPREELDLLPHQLMHAVRMGLKDLVLEARMLWACTECYNCTEGCPQGIEVCDVIYQLKNIAIKERKNLIPRGIRIFANALLDNGRTAEIMEWEREELELPELNGSGDDILKKLLTQMHLSEIINPKPKL
ncbi:MAG: 4Fe-4S dicluster domain-containing protein [Deltaproteobacteria bacterium]|nr:4Fe-4S dicluster domain-containing protein [Deltaproteobacteria bacterium]MBW2671623.1 4Fe-4S dicluster domain-containing protein [Deltaproteobacteria bacterium]